MKPIEYRRKAGGGAAMACAALALLYTGGRLYAASAREWVARGNRAYAEERYEEALAAYQEAGVAAPESARIVFNRALALYRQGEFAKAAEAFAKADARAKERALRARCKFNLGNCAYRAAERQPAGDLEKALDGYRRSVRYYQDAVELDPEFREAAENIEITRRAMKTLMDEMKKRQEAAQQQRQAQQQAARQVAELLDRQQAALEENKRLSAQKDAGEDPEAGQEPSAELAREQQTLADETRALADELQEQLQQPAPGSPPRAPDDAPGGKAREELERAVGEQQLAAEGLERNEGRRAEPRQANAVEALKHALEALQDPPEAPAQPAEDGERADPRPSPPPDGEDAAQSPEARQDAEGQSPPEENLVPLADEARDILDWEEENRQRRRAERGGVRPVDKDW